jgi:hypothetical protein
MSYRKLNARPGPAVDCGAVGSEGEDDEDDEGGE